MKVRLISSNSTTDLTQGTDYNVSDRVVTLTNPTSLKIQIYRETTTKPLVGWADASVLRAADMTVQSTQLLHLSEETMDKVQDGGLAQDTNDGVWDARYNRIKNLLDPKDPGDAVTLSYIVANQTSLINALKATGKEQNESIVSTGNTQNTRLTTTGDTQNKRLTDTGDSYVSTMTTLKNTATTKATEAGNSAELSKKWAMSSTSPDGVAGNKSSKTWAEEAKSSASASATSAKNSSNSASASSASASAAKTSETNAKNSATASANSASASSASASAAKTSETNAKNSATASANSASAAAKSAENAKTWDPTYYNKVCKWCKDDNKGNPTVLIMERVYQGSTQNNTTGGTFTIYLKGVIGYQRVFFTYAPTNIAVTNQYKANENYWTSAYLTSNNPYMYPMFLKETSTGYYYWGIVLADSSYDGGYIYGGWKTGVVPTTPIKQLLCTKKDVNALPEGWEYVNKPCTIYKQPTKDEWNSKADLSALNALSSTVSKDISNLSSEAAKWRKAYNDLRKRSYPTQFDDDELTVLMDTPIRKGAITLSQPYTDFDGLLIENTNDDRYKLNRTFISTAEFNARMQRAKEIKPTAATMNLLTNAWEWDIWVLESEGFTSTYFPNYTENCVIERIYGVKFKDIPDADLSSTAVSTQPAQVGETPVVVNTEDTNVVEV